MNIQTLTHSHVFTPDDWFVPGERLPDTAYQIVRWIKESATGMVFEAIDVDTREQVVIEILKASSLHDAELRDHFFAEAELVASIESPFVVDVLDYGELPDGRPYQVATLLEPTSLGDLLRKHGPLPLPRALPILRQCCKALAAVHAHGIAHRGIEPGNLLVQSRQDRADAVRLINFHRAAAFGTRPRVTGAVAYMAPEQIRGAAVDPRGDLYALGCVAFEMLTGRPPYRCANRMSMVHAHLHWPIPLVRDRCPKLPEIVDEVIGTCLAKRPEDRFSSTVALEVALCDLAAIADVETPWDAILRFDNTAFMPRLGEVTQPRIRPAPPAVAA